MSSELLIREATSADFPTIKQICQLSFGPVYRHFAIQSLSSKGAVLVCEADGLVVGFAKLVQSQMGSLCIGNILWLAVRPEFRRKNAGSALIAASLSHFHDQGIGRVCASIEYNNKPAIALFQKNGFRRIRFRNLMTIFGRHILKFYSEFWVAPIEVVMMHCDSISGSIERING